MIDLTCRFPGAATRGAVVLSSPWSAVPPQGPREDHQARERAAGDHASRRVRRRDDGRRRGWIGGHRSDLRIAPS
ncbi:hypothetical protein SERN_2338 [Serinibacter arcticus]|uniref:Uncharacterized protein n=1 Tax=Serinibacter arcticus TaxID=1655435 RepID=A0A4Z1DYG3_9MICO|nr:hypothetical protein SERN_2338 [Serinibacter arcticus]